MERKDFFATKSLLLYILLPSFPLEAKDGTQSLSPCAGQALCHWAFYSS